MYVLYHALENMCAKFDDDRLCCLGVKASQTNKQNHFRIYNISWNKLGLGS